MTADSVVKTETAGPSDSERSTSDVMRAIASESQTLVQKQIELARIELLEAVDARRRRWATRSSSTAVR